MISLKTHRDAFTKTIAELTDLKNDSIDTFLEKLDVLGKRGVDALVSATPIDTGKTASMWRYEIVKTSTGYELSWINDNVNDDVNVAIIIQYGHGTKNGGYVRGRDYINSALKKLFADFLREIDGCLLKKEG